MPCGLKRSCKPVIMPSMPACQGGGPFSFSRSCSTRTECFNLKSRFILEPSRKLQFRVAFKYCG